MTKDLKISIVTPVFNEEEVIEEFHRKVTAVMARTDHSYEIIFVDDGSRDESQRILRSLKEQDRHTKVVCLARNFGHQLAITAGMRYASGQAVVVMDSDLQDPPEAILKFIEEWQLGYDVIYGIRSERKGETFFKKVTASLFYKLIRKVTNIDIAENVGDFYLLDRKVVDDLNKMEERHRFIRGLVAWVGYKRAGVEYVREERFAGKTKFGFWRMLKFAFDAATSFSFTPLRAISAFGAVISFLAFAGILVTVYQKFFTDRTITGWSSLMVVILFIGGIQLLSIGVIGEYIARIGDDVKHRPLFTVREFLE